MMLARQARLVAFRGAQLSTSQEGAEAASQFQKEFLERPAVQRIIARRRFYMSPETSGAEYEAEKARSIAWKLVFAAVILGTTAVDVCLFTKRPALFLHVGTTIEDDIALKQSFAETLQS